MVAAPRREAGKMRLGCLAGVVVLVAVVYAAIAIIPVYWRAYQMQDEVKTQASFAPALTDKVILERLVAMADTLRIPLGPTAWYIHRTSEPREITIRGVYDDSVVFQLISWRKIVRFHFTPSAKAAL
ncbi:MAG TPA: hypothetical protein VMF70_00470 [Gemmatimonadales bacterium]|nr:hypothetical protein [Gemmatimonadales bacterium]